MKAYYDIEQGSAAWFKLRAGIPTSSEFNHIIQPKKMEPAAARHKYACRLIAEKLLNWQAESLDKIQHIQDGKMNEATAVIQLEETFDIQTKKVGIILTDDGRFGASPDRLAIDKRGEIDWTIEVKCPTIPTQIQYLLLGHDDSYKAQVQGHLFVAEADKALFYSYSPRTPAYQVETGRDEIFIRALRDCLERFSDELSAMMARAQSLGLYQAFPEILTPLEAERGDQLRSAPLTSVEDMARWIEED